MVEHVSFLDALAGVQGTLRPACKVREYRDSLDDADRAALDGAFAAGLPARRIGSAIRQTGFAVSDGTVLHHLRGACSCESL